jgi:hypothetical protein
MDAPFDLPTLVSNAEERLKRRANCGGGGQDYDSVKQL